MDLLRGPAPDADEHDKVEPDQYKRYQVSHSGGLPEGEPPEGEHHNDQSDGATHNKSRVEG
ncbi:hypothetical protein MBOURGENBZM_13680 [Methanoculleus bourgensis]|nr:hypothetical protein MBOURGENBZM_13680 [Methanoculleus bourgensis]